MKTKEFTKFHWEFEDHSEDYMDYGDEVPYILVTELRTNDNGYIYLESEGVKEEILKTIKTSKTEEDLYQYLYDEGIVEWM